MKAGTYIFLSMLSAVIAVAGAANHDMRLSICGLSIIVLASLVAYIQHFWLLPAQYVCNKCGKATKKSKVNTGYNYQLELPTWTCPECGEVHVVDLRNSQQNSPIGKEIS